MSVNSELHCSGRLAVAPSAARPCWANPSDLSNPPPSPRVFSARFRVRCRMTLMMLYLQLRPTIPERPRLLYIKAICHRWLSGRKAAFLFRGVPSLRFLLTFNSQNCGVISIQIFFQTNYKMVGYIIIISMISNNINPIQKSQHLFY